jgi:hypothetical protein
MNGGPIGYKIYRSTSNDYGTASYLNSTSGDETYYDDYYLMDGKTYWYWVRAYQGIGGEGDPSNGDSGYPGL